MYGRKTWREEQAGRPKHRWKDIRIDLREMECEGVDWMHLAQDREQWRVLVNTVMNLQVPKNGRESLDYLSDYQLLKKHSV
jgi:hypothetical protein